MKIVKEVKIFKEVEIFKEVKIGIEVTIFKEVKRSDSLWSFACGDVLDLLPAPLPWTTTTFSSWEDWPLPTQRPTKRRLSLTPWWKWTQRAGGSLSAQCFSLVTTLPALPTPLKVMLLYNSSIILSICQESAALLFLEEWVSMTKDPATPLSSTMWRRTSGSGCLPWSTPAVDIQWAISTGCSPSSEATTTGRASPTWRSSRGTSGRTPSTRVEREDIILPQQTFHQNGLQHLMLVILSCSINCNYHEIQFFIQYKCICDVQSNRLKPQREVAVKR